MPRFSQPLKLNFFPYSSLCPHLQTKIYLMHLNSPSLLWKRFSLVLFNQYTYASSTKNSFKIDDKSGAVVIGESDEFFKWQNNIFKQHVIALLQSTVRLLP